MSTTDKTKVNGDERRARLLTAATKAADAYREWAFAQAALLDDSDEETATRLQRAAYKADAALRELVRDRGYREGDHVRLNVSQGPWIGLTGTLAAGQLSDDRYRFGFVFDEPQTFEGRTARICYVSAHDVVDIAPGDGQ